MGDDERGQRGESHGGVGGRKMGDKREMKKEKKRERDNGVRGEFF